MEPMTHSQKCVLITGCSSGIGFASARYLAEQGYLVLATVRKAADAEKLRNLALPNLFPIYPVDLTRPEDFLHVAEQVESELQAHGQKGLYALINNAGGAMVAPVELLNLSAFQTELQTRLVGSVGLVQALLPLLRQDSGRILWIATPAMIPTPYVASIHACDFAVNCLARTLDIELKSWHIENILIRCGGIKTEKGLQTTHEVDAILQHPKAGLYRAALTAWSKEMADFDTKRTPPQKVAEVIAKALEAVHPKKRYSVGYMVGFASLLELLPQSLADKVLKSRF